MSLVAAFASYSAHIATSSNSTPKHMNCALNLDNRRALAVRRVRHRVRLAQGPRLCSERLSVLGIEAQMHRPVVIARVDETRFHGEWFPC
ncbi:hypothetical protein BDV10DRAFT_175541 [Aspergillus recurvatus]